MKYSYTVHARIRRDRKNSDGLSSLYLDVTLNRKKVKLSLSIYWDEKRFHDKKWCLPMEKSNDLSNEYNMIIRKAINRCNEIFTLYRLSEKNLTAEVFKKEYNATRSRHSFIGFFEDTMNFRFKNKQISESTLTKHTTVLKKLKRMYSEIFFYELDDKWGMEFDGKMASEKMNKNSRLGVHKTVNNYLLKAAKEFNFINPYKSFTPRKIDSKNIPLSEEQLKLCIEYYNECSIDKQKIVLRRFLFICMVGLRRSDIQQMTIDQRVGNFLVKVAYKTRNTSGKIVQIPMNDFAQKLWDEELEIRKGDKLFQSFKNSNGIAVYKDIMEGLKSKYGIEFRINNQIARETFATTAAKVMPIQVVQELMGHTDIRTTRKYIKVDAEQKERGVEKLNNLFNN